MIIQGYNMQVDWEVTGRCCAGEAVPQTGFSIFRDITGNIRYLLELAINNRHEGQLLFKRFKHCLASYSTPWFFWRFLRICTMEYLQRFLMWITRSWYSCRPICRYKSCYFVQGIFWSWHHSSRHLCAWGNVAAHDFRRRRDFCWLKTYCPNPKRSFITPS